MNQALDRAKDRILLSVSLAGASSTARMDESLDALEDAIRADQTEAVACFLESRGQGVLAHAVRKRFAVEGV